MFNRFSSKDTLLAFGGPTMSGRYVFNRSVKELRFQFCQISNHSAATRFGPFSSFLATTLSFAAYVLIPIFSGPFFLGLIPSWRKITLTLRSWYAKLRVRIRRCLQDMVRFWRGFAYNARLKCCKPRSWSYGYWRGLEFGKERQELLEGMYSSPKSWANYDENDHLWVNANLNLG